MKIPGWTANHHMVWYVMHCIGSTSHLLLRLTCIVDQYVQPLLPLQEARAEVSHGSQVGQVQLHVDDVQAAAAGLDLTHRALGLVRVATRNDHARASHRQGHGRLFADARTST